MNERTTLRVLPALAVGAIISMTIGCSSLRTTPLTLACAQPVGYTEIEFQDAARNGRRTACRVWYPSQPPVAEAEDAFYILRDIGIAEIGISSCVAKRDTAPVEGSSLPIVLFSHGQGGSTFESIPIAETLASRGFVFVAVAHTGDTYEDEYVPRGGIFRGPVVDRPTDIEFAIDRLVELNGARDGLFPGRLDLDRIGVMGHSFGGFTSLAVVTDRIVPRDPRVKAVMPVVPWFGPFGDEDIASVEVPVFMLGGDRDRNTPVGANIDRAYPLFGSKAPFVGAAIIAKANHYHFSNVDQIGDAIREIGIGRPFWPLLGADRLEDEYAAATTPELVPSPRVKEIESLYALAFFSRFLNDDRRWDLVFDQRYADLFLPEVTLRIRRSDGER